MITIFTVNDLELHLRDRSIKELVREKHLFSWSMLGRSEFAIFSDGKSFFVIKSKRGIPKREVLPISDLGDMLQRKICTCDYPYGKVSEDVVEELYSRDVFILQRVEEIMANLNISGEKALRQAIMETSRGNLIDPEVEQEYGNPPEPEKPWL